MTTAELWSRYVRYIGAGAVAVAGVLTVLRNLPSMAGAFAAVVRGLRRTSGSPALKSDPATSVRTDRDLPGAFVLGGILLVIAVAALVPGVFAGHMEILQRVVCALTSNPAQQY